MDSISEEEINNVMCPECKNRMPYNRMGKVINFSCSICKIESQEFKIINEKKWRQVRIIRPDTKLENPK